MRLIEAIKQKGKPLYIPDCSRDELPQFFKEMGFKVGAEIGVYRGEFCQKFCQAGLTMYAIDPWIGYVGAGKSERSQEMQDYNYQCAQKVLSPYSNCKFIRKTSMKAVADFKPQSLDFVYIDGDHRFRYVAEDIFEWFWKVRKGGIVSGHDYYCTDPWANNLVCQVKPVVEAIIQTFAIENFYTFGQTISTPKEEARGKRNLSWMFIKP